VQEAVDPPLKSTVQGELSAKHFALPEYQKQAAYCDPQNLPKELCFHSLHRRRIAKPLYG
jgi:hypothetical protein